MSVKAAVANAKSKANILEWGHPSEILSAFMDIDNGHGRPEEPWHNENDFDPPFTRGQLRYYARRGWLEIDDTYAETGKLRFRFTPKGRDKFEELQAQGVKP